MELMLNDKQTVYDVVSDCLSRLGVSPVKLGYTYLIEAVVYVLDDEETLCGVTKNLYPHLARMFSTTPQAVERAIRTAISNACALDAEELHAFNGKKEKKLHFTNKEFIYKTVNAVKRQFETVNIDKY